MGKLNSLQVKNLNEPGMCPDEATCQVLGRDGKSYPARPALKIVDTMSDPIEELWQSGHCA